MKSKILLFFVLQIGFMTILTAQETTDKPSFWENVRFGGNLGLDFSNNSTSIIIGPSAVYQFNNQFSAGAGINFGYASFKRTDTRQTNYGGRLIALYNPTRQFQLSGEFEHTFVNNSTEFQGRKIKTSFSVPALHLGAGYRLGNIAAGVRYDVLYNKDKRLYASPWSPYVQVYF